MASYSKLFSSIVTSTIWLEDSDTRVVWVTMLALADRFGEVEGSVPGLARLAGVSTEACDAALKKFLAPDPASRTWTEECQGRRIEIMDGGWSLLNHGKYRRMKSKEEQLEKANERTRRYRRRKASVTDVYASSTRVHAKPTDTDTDTDTDKKRSPATQVSQHHAKSGTRIPSTWRLTDAGRAFAESKGLDPDSTAEAFTDHWKSSNGRNATKRDWDAAFRTWCRLDRGVGSASARAVQAPRGHGAFYDELALIARKDRERGGDGT